MEASAVNSPHRAKGIWLVVDALLDAPRHITPLRFLLFCVTVVFFTYVLGWKTATLILASLYFHESGHLWAAKKLGIETRGLLLTPIGAIGLVRDASPTHFREVFTAIMGPIWGLLGAAAMATVSYLTRSQYLACITVFVCVINVFNLLPVNPLDGGRIMKSFAYSCGKTMGLCVLIGGPILAFIAYFLTHIPLFLLVGVFSLSEIRYENRLQSLLQAMSATEVGKTIAYSSLTLVAFILLGYLMLISLGDANPVDIIINAK